MAVIMTADVAGQTQQGYDGILAALRDRLGGAEGFIAHASHAIESGWRVVEIWETKADSDRFYAREVAPFMPPGIRPKRVTQELHSLVSAVELRASS